MRLINGILAVSAAVLVMSAADAAGAAWRFDENGPHPRIVSRQRATDRAPDARGATSYSKSSIESGRAAYTSTCKRRPSTVKPFVISCVQSADQAPR